MQREFPDATWLERWAPGADPGEATHEGGAEVFVLDGALADEAGEYGPGTWLRLPVGATHRPRSPSGCELWVKYGGLPNLRAGDG